MKIASSPGWLTALLAVVFLLLGAGTAQAQEIQLTGPLAGAPSVRHERLYREGHLELALVNGYTLLDEYERTILVGGRLQYHITDWLGIGVWGAGGVAHIDTNLTDEIQSSAPREQQTAVNVPQKGGSFDNQTGKLSWILTPQIELVPFRGKLAIFQKFFIDADAYFHGGLGIIGIQERGFCGGGGETSCTAASSFSTTGRTAITGSFGLGFRFYMFDSLALGLEYRALPFSWNRSGFDTSGGPPNGNFPDNQINAADRTFDFMQIIAISLGVSFDAGNSFSIKPRSSD